MKSLVERLREQIARPLATAQTLDEGQIWRTQTGPVWRSEKYDGLPSFYPVYRYQENYSYSPLALILLKGRLALDPRVAAAPSKRGFLYYSGTETIDREIERLGGPVRSTYRISDPHVYANRIANAMISDVTAAENANPGLTNIILCGGKDSLNLLLLPWTNPTLVASAPPNFEHVQRFVETNDLDLEVVPLHDEADPSVQRDEILANCCRLNLEHSRWGTDLVRLARDHQGRVVFWKGQLGDVYTTLKWKTITHPVGTPRSFALKVNKRAGIYLPASLRRSISDRFVEPNFRHALWARSAMWQGAHVSLIRDLTDCVVLSGYHGPHMNEVFRDVDLDACVAEDVRPLVGRLLYGAPVRYPEANPSPPPSEFRADLCNPRKFLDALAELGVPVEGDRDQSQTMVD